MCSKFLLGLVTVSVIIIAGCASTGSGWKQDPIPLPPADPNYLHAIGTGNSKDLQLAKDKATLNARTEIARQLELELNTLQKNFAENFQ